VLHILVYCNYNISGYDKLFGWYIISIQNLLHLYYSRHHYSLRTALAPFMFVPPEVAQDVQPVVHDTNRLVPDGVDEYQYLCILDR
jgi:hypothetical protein